MLFSLSGNLQSGAYVNGACLSAPNVAENNLIAPRRRSKHDLDIRGCTGAKVMALETTDNRVSFREGARDRDVLYDLDLLMAAWRWPVDVIERVTGHSAWQLAEMRHHRLEVDRDLMATVQDLKALHYWLWMKPGPASYAAWWRLAIVLPTPWGEVVPLQLMRRVGSGAIEPITAHLRSWATA